MGFVQARNSSLVSHRPPAPWEAAELGAIRGALAASGVGSAQDALKTPLQTERFGVENAAKEQGGSQGIKPQPKHQQEF